ncbi:MAG TPA: APC family permease [Gaiellaceae bacterium]|jgi:amino acid transporter|nr:APC family permease [Gaiellaceae bacterium]
MDGEAAAAVDVGASEDARLESLGYKPQLNRVLGFFSNFAVGFTYLSPMVGIYSLFVFGLGIAGPAYIWLTFIPLIGMLFVALVFGELASHYPVAGALFQYSKYTVGPRFGWLVGWFYGFALLITVAAVDTGVVFYVTTLLHNWFGNSWLGSLDATGHGTILVITLILLAVQTTVNITGARIMADVAKFGVYVEIVGTLGIALILGIHGFHHGFSFLFSTQGAQHAATNGEGLNFNGSWLAAALVAVLAPVYIFYGFESCGDIAEETKDAGRQIPRAMRHALIWGGIASLILTGGLLLATAKHAPVATTVANGIPGILAQLPSGLQDFLLLVIIFAFFSCGSSIQGAGSRLAFSYARDGALPGSGWLSRVNQRFKTPVNSLLMGAVITVLFCLLVYINPGSDYHIWFVTYPAHVNALVALVSFGVSGIYLSFLLTVIGAIIARARGWRPEGAFRLGKWAWPVLIVAGGYLAAMFVNVVYPSGLSSGRAIFNIDWITLFIIFIIAVVGGLYLLIGRPDRNVQKHLHDPLEPSGAELPGAAPTTT